jgi:phage terminase small subunit
VTFCHIIANPLNGNDDLCLLAEFVATLRSLEYLSEGVAKLYRLCDIFQKIAELYTQAKIQEANRHNQQNDISSDPVIESMQPAVNDIDGYLSSIGFAPPSTPNTFSGVLVDDAQLDADYLSNWFDGNNTLMGLLEQDLAYTGWPDTTTPNYQ